MLLIQGRRCLVWTATLGKGILVAWSLRHCFCFRPASCRWWRGTGRKQSTEQSWWEEFLEREGVGKTGYPEATGRNSQESQACVFSVTGACFLSLPGLLWPTWPSPFEGWGRKEGLAMKACGQLPPHQDSQLGSGPFQMANIEHQQMLPGEKDTRTPGTTSQVATGQLSREWAGGNTSSCSGLEKGASPSCEPWRKLSHALGPGVHRVPSVLSG